MNNGIFGEYLLKGGLSVLLVAGGIYLSVNSRFYNDDMLKTRIAEADAHIYGRSYDSTERIELIHKKETRENYAFILATIGTVISLVGFGVIKSTKTS